MCTLSLRVIELPIVHNLLVNTELNRSNSLPMSAAMARAFAKSLRKLLRIVIALNFMCGFCFILPKSSTI